MFEFEKPKIEIAEISEDNKYGKFVVELWREVMVQLLVILLEESCCHHYLEQLSA